MKLSFFRFTNEEDFFFYCFYFTNYSVMAKIYWLYALLHFITSLQHLQHAFKLIYMNNLDVQEEL